MLPKIELSKKEKDFLKLFPGTLYTYIGDGPASSLPVIHSEILDTSRQEQGYGVFFSVNGFSGNKRDQAHLTSINAFYQDIDYPKYLDKDPVQIQQFKNEMVMDLAEREVTPTIINSTKNGLHVFWILKKPIYLNELNEDQRKELMDSYRKVEMAMAHQLEGDTNAVDLSRVLRVPGTFHQKDPNDPYQIKIEFYNEELLYTFSEIKAAFLKKPAPDEWAEVNVEAGLSDEIKKAVEKLYPRLERPSYKTLLNKDEGVPEGFRNKALLIAAHACKEAGWSLQQTYEYFDHYQGLSIHEIRKTIRSSFDHTYEFGYNNDVMQNLVPAEERAKLSEVTGKALSKSNAQKNLQLNNTQKEVYLTYEHVLADRYPFLKSKLHADFYNYENGVYVPMSGDDLKSLFLREMLKDGLTLYRKVSAVNDKIACFKSLDGRQFRHSDENPNPAVLNLKNGLLDIYTGQLYAHDPNYLSTAQIPIDYDPYAKAPRWKQFIMEVTDGDPEQALLLQQLAGYCLTNETSFAKAFIFIGSGANGKSLFTRMISKLVGRHNVSNLNLTSISKQFGLTGLVGKRLNIIDEISGNYFESNIIKNLISGEPISIDIKFRPEPLEFTPIAKIIFSVNQLPKINDTTQGLYRRFIIIPFLRSFLANPDLDLESKLTEELAGILNWSIEGLRLLREEGHFHETQKNFAIMNQFKAENSPLLEFLLEEYVPADERFSEPVNLIYQKYRNYCLNNGYKHKSINNFSKEIIDSKYDGWHLGKIRQSEGMYITGLQSKNKMNPSDVAYLPHPGSREGF